MRVIDAIEGLRREGYTVALDGDALRIIHDCGAVPDRSRVIPCLETLKKDKEEALKCLRVEKDSLGAGKISPASAYRIDSDLLGCHFWFVETCEDAERLRREGIAETIYTREEIQHLKGVSKEALRAVHAVKEIIEDGVIEEITAASAGGNSFTVRTGADDMRMEESARQT